MMRIVKENSKARHASPNFSDARNQLRLVPLVYENKVETVERFVQIQALGGVCLAAKVRKCTMEAFDCFRPVIASQVLTAPAVARLEDSNRVPSRNQLRRDTSEEVRVPVVPV